MMHIFSMKSQTKKLSIETIPDPSFFYLPLSLHIGQAAKPIVAIGDHVLKYQLIANSVGQISAKIHAPASGIIKEITENQIVLENDFKDDEIGREPILIENLTEKELLNIIQDAGIVGEGGAQFPTHVKYDLRGKKVETFIINGTECEPYLTADYALMKERTKELFRGITIANTLLNAQNIVMSIEKQNEDLLNIFKPFLAKPEYKNIKIVVLPNQYPQGGELQLIKSVTGKELAKGVLPINKGILVSNVGTIDAIYNAVVEQKSLVERVITISGEVSKKAGNFRVKIGTPINHILNTQGFTSLPDNHFLTLGGPMMGKHIDDISKPIIKGSSSVLFFKKKEIKRNNCISCGYCVDVCPMKLMPMKFAEIYANGKYTQLEKYNLSSCIECAACEYICPTDVPLIESIKEGKEKLKMIVNNAN